MARAGYYSYRNNNKQNINGTIFPRQVPYAVLVILMGVVAVAFFVTLILANLFPRDLTLILTIFVLGLLIISSALMSRPRRSLRIIGIVLGVIFLAVVGLVTYYLGTTYSTMSQISDIKNKSNAEVASISNRDIDPTKDAFNLYISGIDRWAGEDDLDRSDVNMIMTVNPVTKKIMLTSIPRDTYVKVHSNQQMDKLTHTGINGVEDTVQTVEDWMGIDIDYYLKLNFSAMRGIINAIGGIDVYSPVAFDSDISDCSYVKGWNHLNGRQALYFARERHAFEGQDEMRVQNQQRVVEAIIKKLTGSPALLTGYANIMHVAGSNMSTNLSYEEIQSLVKMQMTDLASWKFDNQKIEGNDDMDYVASLSGKRKYSIFRADENSVKKAVDGMNKVMNPSEEELKEAEAERGRGFISSIIRLSREKAQKAKEKIKS